MSERVTGIRVGPAATMIAAAIIAAIAGAGCGKQATPPPEPPKQLRIGMLPKLDIPYFQACYRGAAEAARELGLDLDYFASANLSVEEQIARVEEWIAQGFDMIVIAPNDPERIAPILKKAKAAGIVVVTYDADANPEASGRAAFVNQASTEAIGAMLVDVLAEAIGKKGKALIVSSTPTAPNQNAWMAVMKPKLARDYPQIELIQDLMPGEDQNNCREQTLQAVNAHPDLKGIWGLTSKALPGAAEAVRQAGRSGKVYVTGLGLPSEVKQHVMDGTIEKFLLWSPVDLGYLAVHVARSIKAGTFAPGTQTFGRLSNIAVSEKEVLLGPPKVYTKSNIDEAGF